MEWLMVDGSWQTAPHQPLTIDHQPFPHDFTMRMIVPESGELLHWT